MPASATVAALLRAPTGLEPSLQAVADVVGRRLGFATVAINLYRPALDALEVVAVHGSDVARQALLHTTTAPDTWDPLMADEFRHGSVYLVEHDRFAWDDVTGPVYVPTAPADGVTDASWHPEDALFVPLRDADDTLLGILSVDEPVDWRRPEPAALDALAAVAEQASLAIASAQLAERAQHHQRALGHLLRLTGELTHPRSPDEVLDALAEGVAEAFGFERVMVWSASGDGLERRVARGWAEDAPLASFPVSWIARLLEPARLRYGCALFEQERAHELVDPAIHAAHRTSRNGAGRHGWDHHWLLIPVISANGTLAAVLWADDPRDRMLPGEETLQALRAFADVAATALANARHTEDLRVAAEHDPLTGLRNRRGLDDELDRVLAAGGAVLLFDMDWFKRINDQLGYATGDAVLRRVGEVLRTQQRACDVVARLGGEEFVIAMPGGTRESALAVAERLRVALRPTLEDQSWPVTFSGGISATAGPAAAERMIREANRALQAAKRLGRDRCVVFAPDTLEALLGDLARSEESSEQIRSVLLLAKTMDLRDSGTSDHSEVVGRYSEAISRALGMSPERVERLRIAGALHDLGKLAVADAILHKPGPLDPSEWAEMQRHPEIGARILESAGLHDIAGWIAAHHERVDGRGYPAGLAGEAIPLEARVLAVADAFEAMIADRPYREGLTPAQATEELVRCAGTQFDPQVVAAFLAALEDDATRIDQAAGRPPTGPDATSPRASARRRART